VYREIYWVAVVVASIGFAHDGRFLLAQTLLDKAMVLGLDRRFVRNFFDHIEHHANEQYQGPLVALGLICEAGNLPNYEIISAYCLSKQIAVPLFESVPDISQLTFEKQYVATETPVVLRGFAGHSGVTTKWR